MDCVFVLYVCWIYYYYNAICAYFYNTIWEMTHPKVATMMMTVLLVALKIKLELIFMLFFSNNVNNIPIPNHIQKEEQFFVERILFLYIHENAHKCVARFSIFAYFNEQSLPFWSWLIETTIFYLFTQHLQR